MQLFGVVFPTFCGQKKIENFKRYFSIRIEKLHKMDFIILFLKKLEKIEKINFNFECNTERGFKEPLYSTGVCPMEIGLPIMYVLVYYINTK